MAEAEIYSVLENNRITGFENKIKNTANGKEMNREYLKTNDIK